MNLKARLKMFLTDYCSNSTLSSLSYLVDSRFHYTERLFWVFCIILSLIASYFLIDQTMIDYKENSVSLTIENFKVHDVSYFPSIGVCETGSHFPRNISTEQSRMP